MNSGDNLPVQEIVIIRRKHDDGDEGHRGGMWKIAFADFMTAMMAFFLVMWLISASDEKTLDQLSTYFNPIKLPDTQRADKTLQTAGDAGAPEVPEEHKVDKAEKRDPNNEGEEAEKEERHEDSSAGKQKVADESLFADPYGVLSKIATQVVRVPLPMQGARKDDATNFSGGAAFRDPFDPDFRRRSAEAADSLLAQDTVTQNNASRAGARKTAANDDTPDEGGDDAVAPQSAAQPSGASEAEKALLQSAQTRLGEAKVDPGAAADAAIGNAAKADSDTAVRQLESDIRDSLRQAGIPDLPDIAIERKSEGILISLTDRMNFEMFSSSSATPRPELVLAMERIGKLLQARPEKIVVRGHTDSRRFRTGSYDNWRLSTDRAHIAHYMLARSGLPESRFERIEGHADRNLKIPDDAKAASNRRIEILIRQPTS